MGATGARLVVKEDRHECHVTLAAPRRVRLEPGNGGVVVLGKGITLPRRTSALRLPRSRHAERLAFVQTFLKVAAPNRVQRTMWSF